MKKRFLCVLLVLSLLASLLALPAAAMAETSSEKLLDDVRASILERSRTSNTRYELKDVVKAENFLDFTVQQFAAFTGDTQDQVLFYVYVEVAATADAENNYSMSDYDFTLCAYSSAERTDDSFLMYTPSNVYDVTDGRVQELMWPVSVYGDRSYTLCLIYTIPAAVSQVAIVETNMMGSDDTGVQSMGPIYSMTVPVVPQAPAESAAPEDGAAAPDEGAPTQEPSTL